MTWRWSLQSKLAGELAVANTLEKYFIVRIAWVFGLNGKNFIKTMINVGKTHDTVRVVNDQIGTPTYTRDLSRLLADMVKTEKYGYYHATNEGGYISWYEFCCEFYRQYGLQTRVIPVSTAEYGLSKASRPFNSRLDKSKLREAGFLPLPTWQDAVSRYLRTRNGSASGIRFGFKERQHERNHISRWKRNAALSADEGDVQAAPSNL